MTPNSTSEPELEGTPVVIADPPATDVTAETTPPVEDKPSVKGGPVDDAKSKAAVDAAQPASGEKQAEEKAAGEAEPSTRATADPVVNEPVAAEPVASQPVASEPAVAKPPSAAEPIAAEPVAAKPAAAEPVVAEPIDASASGTAGSQTTPVEVVPVPAPYQASGVTEVLVVGEEEIFEDDEYEPPTSADGRYPTLVPLVGALVGLIALIALLVGAFAFPAVHTGPHELPIGVAGSPTVTPQLKGLFTAKNSKTFDVTIYSTEAELKTAIRHRKVYGGLSLTDTAATMLVSSAASPTAAETLESVANQLGSTSQTQIAVSDVVATPKGDPRGDGLASIAFPLVLASLLPALVLIPLYRRRPAAQIGVGIAASVLAGLVLSGILTSWLKVTQGANFWLLGLSLAAGIAAVSLVLVGLNLLAGRIGAAIGAAVVVLVSAPLSGLTSAPEWLPRPWGTIGQLLPAGANATLLRSTAFFHGHGGLPSLLVLGIWALIGLLLVLIGTALNDRKTRVVEPVAD